MSDTKLTKTLVTFLLDRSSSMGSCWDSTIEAFNGYLDGMKKGAPDLIEFTLLQFDTNGTRCDIEKVCVATPVLNAPLLNKSNYQPRGSTPLIESAIKTINAVADSLTKRDDKPKVVVCIQTDGEENSSGAEYTWDSLKQLISAKQGEGWEFNFMGAGIDAYQQSAQMGIAAASTMSYDHTNLQSTKSAYATRGATTAMYASGAVADMTITLSEKKLAGDKFDKSLNPGASGKTTNWGTPHPTQSGPRTQTAALDLSGSGTVTAKKESGLDLTK